MTQEYETSPTPYAVADGVLATGPAPVAAPPQSRVSPTHDGTWRAVWRGRSVDRSFPNRSAALAHNERCDRAGELLP